MTTDSPDQAPSFSHFRALMETLPDADETAAAAAATREAGLTKPPGALGRLEEISGWLASWQRAWPPRTEQCVVAVFAGNHGVVARKVAPYPAEVTAQMVANFRAGGAAINQFCEVAGAGLKVFELALEIPTRDITQGPAMEERDCAATMAFGRDAIAEGADILCLGEMGIGNTTIAAAIAHGLYGGKPEDWVGPGTGSTGELLVNKIAAVRDAVALHRDVLGDPFEVLRCLGGREFAAIAGAILAARYEKVPVILDGYGATAAAAILHAANPRALDHCLAGHVSAEPAHARLLERLGLEPVLDLGLRLGEGTGAALALGVVKSAVAAHRGMATFADAGVSDKA
ncbi:Nicotinate-nucleotide--dimethylbenzimidazole phosphoribosyltransferase [hydrothermal vent metagenome]|uniref:Nicotinate-nucleotide--dimethylbenzimidazole phosphoribosyltransferase n=1 Tax=hydrothermal vent metagenome TaxID=652676 RepID=A0A3B0T5D7_9ZZZZ